MKCKKSNLSKRRSIEKEAEPCISTGASHTSRRKFIVDSGALQHNINALVNILDVEHIDPISVHLADDTVLLARNNGLVCMDLSFSGDNEKTVALLLVRNIFYIP